MHLPRPVSVMIGVVLSVLLVGCTVAEKPPTASQPADDGRYMQEIADLTRENKELKDRLDAVQAKLDEVTRLSTPSTPAKPLISRDRAVEIAQKSAANMKPKNARLFQFVQNGNVSIWVVDFDYRPDFTYTVIVDAITGNNLYAPNPPSGESGN